MFRKLGNILFRKPIIFVLLLILVQCEIKQGELRFVVFQKPDEGKTNGQFTWSYSGDKSPKYWGHLDKGYSACTNGKEQSPVNIDIPQIIVDKHPSVKFHYKSTTFKMNNNGHNIESIPNLPGNFIVLNGKHFELEQFHFHTPSEHTLNNKHFEMELHLVHKGTNGTVIVGIMIKKGNQNNAASELWSHLQSLRSGETDKSIVKLERLLPQQTDVLRYSGSLTTPPCTEGITWIILSRPIEMSIHQINTFRSRYRDNHRPIQRMYQRKIIGDLNKTKE